MKAKTTELSIGNSKVFGDRFFPGGIDDVALGTAHSKRPTSRQSLPQRKPVALLPNPACYLRRLLACPVSQQNAKLPTLPAHLAFLSGYENITKIEAEDWSEEHFPPSPWVTATTRSAASIGKSTA